MKQIATALHKFQKELPKVSLNSTVEVTMKGGGSYNFKYTTLSHIVDSVLPALTANDLAFAQTFSNGCLVTTLFHISGECIVSEIPLNTDSGSMQEVGSRITYLKRYSLSAMLGVVAEEDDDANISCGNTYTKGQPKKAAPKPAANKPDTPDGEMSKAQWSFIEKCSKDESLSKDETIELVKWVAGTLNVEPRHWKVAKALLPLEAFQEQIEKYNEYRMLQKDDIDF